MFCASSRQCDPLYHQAAFELGRLLAQEKITIVYGGGAVGSMGYLANGALSENGRVIGVIPEFMFNLEWGHPQLTRLEIVPDMATRKRKMTEDSDAVIAMPGGSGTMEELFETITMKRLGFYHNPIILLNIAGYFDPLIEMLNRMIDEHFMDPRHRQLWQVAEKPGQVVPAILSAPSWFKNAREFAAI